LLRYRLEIPVNAHDKQSNHEHQKKYSMTIRTAEAFWEGSSKDGKGKVSLGSGAFEGDYSYSSRFEDGKGTNDIAEATRTSCPVSVALASVPITLDAKLIS